MKIKSLFGAGLMLLTIGLAGCEDKDEGYTGVVLKETSVRVPYPETYGICIEGGSGEYASSIDRSAIADVEIERTFGAGTILRIRTKEEGEALITVTDKKSGKTAHCSLSVGKGGIPVTDIRYGVEAGRPEAILADLKEREPYPAGSRFQPVSFSLTEGASGEWFVFGADEKKIENGRYTVTEVKGTLPAVCLRLIPVEEQILTWCTLRVDAGDTERIYYLVLTLAPGATGNSAPAYADAYFYEDLTGFYRTEYPDAGVNAAVRAYIRRW